ncbi:MAG TPA: FAD-dependent oxidoreductase [Rubricoccaceae bacterium]
MRLAVIGGLAAGPAAASEASRAGADVTLFEQEPHVSVGACEIPYYVSGRLGPDASLEVLTPEQLAATRGITVLTRHRVVGIDPTRGRLTVEALGYGSVRDERFDRFILATGARARRLGVAGEDAAGVFALRHLTDAEALKRWLETEPVRHVVVVGGGYVGLEIAEAVCERGLRATILEPLGRVLPGGFAAGVTVQMSAAVQAAGVAVRGERVTGFRTDRLGRVSAVETDRGELVGCQAVVVAVGVEPRTELAVTAGLRIGATGGVWTDDRMQTSHRAVWACGDGAELSRPVDGARVLWPLAPTGRRTARVAARNAAARGGTGETFAGVTGAVGVRAFGVEAAAVGVTEDQARAAGIDAVAVQVRHVTRSGDYPGACPIDVRLVAERGTGRLLGGQLVAREGAVLRADVLVPLVRHRATARELSEDTDLIYTPPVAPAIDPLRKAAAELVRAVGEKAPRGRSARGPR